MGAERGGWWGAGSVDCDGEVGGEAAKPIVSKFRLIARQAGFLVWLRWECRYFGCVNVWSHPVQRVVDMVVVGCRLGVSQ